MFALAVVLALFTALPARGGEPTWTVAPRVTVGADDLRLSDLVSGAPASWSSVALGKSPRPGSERTLNRAWILQRAREVGADRLLDAPETVVVARAGRTIDREEVVRAVEEALGRGGRSAVRVTSVGLPGKVPEGDVSLNVLPPEGDPAAGTTVWVDVVCQGKVAGRAWARVEGSRGGGALALVRSLRRGDVVRPEDVEVRPDKPVRGQNLTDPAHVVGKRATRNVAAGTALSAGDVEEVPGVEKGQPVQLVARVGGITATTTGRALERARIGEGVRVENLGSGRVLQGILREPGVVEIRSDFGRQP